MDKTYVKVKWKWVYLYRAFDKYGNTIDFYLSSTRNTKAAERFLNKALRSIPKHLHPKSINTDKNPINGRALTGIKSEA